MSRIVHWEIVGPDGDAMKEFYGSMFGWSFESPEGFGDYHLVSDAHSGVGGAVGKGNEEMPHYVTLYLEVPDIDAKLSEIEAAGGSTVTPKTVIPDMVTFAMFKDPGGNVVGLVEGGGE